MYVPVRLCALVLPYDELVTIAAGAAGRRFHRTAMWLAHRQPHVAVVALVPLSLAAGWPQSIGLTVTAVVAQAFVCVTFAAENLHQTQLCPRCVKRMPLDGPLAVRRRARWLRIHHRGQGHAARFVWLACLVFVLFGPSWVGQIPLLVLWLVTGVANLIHRPLQPWCCGWWRRDDDDGRTVPTPDPIDVGQAR